MKNRTKWLINLVTDIRQFVKPGQPAQYKTTQQHNTTQEHSIGVRSCAKANQVLIRGPDLHNGHDFLVQRYICDKILMIKM